MDDFVEFIELEIEPIPPETVASTKAQLLSLIETTLHDVGKYELYDDQQIKIEVERTFPTDAAIIVGLTFATQIALETYKQWILPALIKRFHVKTKTKKSKSKK